MEKTQIQEKHLSYVDRYLALRVFLPPTGVLSTALKRRSKKRVSITSSIFGLPTRGRRRVSLW
jgi:hypothetical protein